MIFFIDIVNGKPGLIYGMNAKLSPKCFFKFVAELKEIAFAIVEVE